MTTEATMEKIHMILYGPEPLSFFELITSHGFISIMTFTWTPTIIALIIYLIIDKKYKEENRRKSRRRSRKKERV